MADRHNPPRGWRGAPSGESPAGGARHRPSGSSSKQKQIFIVLAVMLALAGGIAGLVYLLRSPADLYFVPLFITQYSNRQIPVNSQAERDRQAFEDGHYFPPMNTFDIQEKGQLLKVLANLKERKPSDTLVLYLCAFARASEEGKVLLLPGDYNPDEPKTAISLNEVLEKLQDCHAGHKLLILDTMRPLADPRLEVLSNNVASRIAHELQELKDPRLLVLLSCSPGQVSLTSEDLGRSVFGFYVEEGLRGWADANGDGHVSARELAEFVKRRVDRWAKENYDTRQTPILLPKDGKEDFRIIALDHGKPKEELPAADRTEYPDLLMKAWRIRDRAWEDGGYQLAPRAFRELEAALLRAELQWRGGVFLDRLKNDLEAPQGALDRFQDQLKQAREYFLGASRPLTETRSLILAQALGQKPDPAVAPALKDILTKALEGAKGKPPELDPAFLEKYKGKYFDVACAAFDQVKDEASPSVEKIRFLALLLQTHDPQLRYVESQAIFRLAKMSQDFRAWPAATAGRALALVRQGELAVSRPRVLPWVRPLLEEAAQDRHVAEVFLWTPGWASLKDAENQLSKASEKYKTILEFEETLVQAHRILDEALIRLPTYLPYLEAPRHSDETWREAVQSAQELREALAQYPDPKKTNPSDLKKMVMNIGQKADSLQSQMNDLRRPFTSDNLRQIIARAKESSGNASVSTDIQLMLATPILNEAERVALWSAGRDLATTLNDKTLKLDTAENQRRQLTTLSDFAQEQKQWAQNERERANRRASWSIALLRLIGLSQAEVEKRDESRKQATTKPDDGAWDQLGASLRKAWMVDIPRQMQETTPAAKDRLSVLYPPFDDAKLVDANAKSYLMQLTLELKEWLANWYRYESRDLANSAFFEESAGDYRADSRLNLAPSAETEIQFSEDTPVPSVTWAHPLAKIVLRLNLIGAAAEQPVEVNTFTADDDWLEVTPNRRDLEKLRAAGSSCALSIDVALKSGAQTATTPRPQGFLVQAKVNERFFHYRVPVRLAPGPEVFLSASSAGPKDPIHDVLALRPGNKRLKYYLYAHNPTAQPYKLKVELLDKGAPIEGGVFQFLEPPLQPNDTKRIEFGKAPPPDGPFKDMQGPLQIRLVDLTTNKELETKQIQVQIANPRDYVEIIDPVFEPNVGGKNKLTVTLRAKADIPEPGCEVKLVLPTDRIPGYTPRREEGKFSEVLMKKEEVKTLTATGIQLDEASNPNGFFYLTVDGVPRAFIYKTTFNRDGGETRPDRFDSFDLRFQTPPGKWYFNSNEKFEVEVNVDNPPEGAKVLLELAEDGTPNVDRPASPVEARYQHLGMSPISPDGALLFEAKIGDRSIPLDIRDIVGKRIVRATLKNSEGASLKTFSKPITLDNSEPINLKVVQAEEIANGMAEISVQGEDPESDIKAVRFYLGKPAGKKPPANAAPIDANYDKEKKTWTKQIPIPQPGEVDLTAEFVNNVDMSAVKALKVTMTNPNAGAGNGGGPVKLGRIKGTVKNGMHRQPGAKVTLQGPKLKEPMVLETDQAGEFSFSKVPPGTYKLTAVDMFGQMKGSADVTVESDKLAMKDVAITR